ncbi:MAG: hypothetical protein JST75_14085 [Bacteroidetes bacterium]|nr:hypothetical protein [Bacteroidota bacterium]
MKQISAVFIFSLFTFMSFAQEASSLVQKARAKIEQVNSYEADGTMKTNVNFLKVPEAKVKIYFKKPDKLKIKNENGISLVPKSILGIGLNNLLTGNFTVLDAGSDILNNIKVKIVKLIPVDENSPVVLSTAYIDPVHLVILKAKITTKENGTYEIEMSYGKYVDYALPDKITCTFNIKDYKLPKGVTLDYDDGSKKISDQKLQDTKGRVEIFYASYAVNKNIPDTVF